MGSKMAKCMEYSKEKLTRLVSKIKISGPPPGSGFPAVTLIQQSWPMNLCEPKLAGKWQWILFQDQRLVCRQLNTQDNIGSFCPLHAIEMSFRDCIFFFRLRY